MAGVVVAVAEGAGPDALVTVDCGGERLLARVTRRSVAGLGLAPGRAVFAIVKAVTFDRGNTAEARVRAAAAAMVAGRRRREERPCRP